MQCHEAQAAATSSAIRHKQPERYRTQKHARSESHDPETFLWANTLPGRCRDRAGTAFRGPRISPDEIDAKERCTGENDNDSRKTQDRDQ